MADRWDAEPFTPQRDPRGGSSVIAQLMGHAKVDTTLNVYAQVLDDSVRQSADRVGSRLITVGPVGPGSPASWHRRAGVVYQGLCQPTGRSCGLSSLRPELKSILRGSVRTRNPFNGRHA
jgi:hypothetical protein